MVNKPFGYAEEGEKEDSGGKGSKTEGYTGYVSDTLRDDQMLKTHEYVSKGSIDKGRDWKEASKENKQQFNPSELSQGMGYSSSGGGGQDSPYKEHYTSQLPYFSGSQDRKMNMVVTNNTSQTNDKMSERLENRPENAPKPTSAPRPGAQLPKPRPA